jgi:hypothetical protein
LIEAHHGGAVHNIHQLRPRNDGTIGRRLGKARGYVPGYFFTSNPSGTGTCVDRAKLQVDKNMIPFCTLQFMNKIEHFDRRET